MYREGTGKSLFLGRYMSVADSFDCDNCAVYCAAIGNTEKNYRILVETMP